MVSRTDPPPLRHFAFPTLGSTSDTAAGLLRDGEVPPFCVTATTQTAGRGQRGRIWTSPAGNLYVTYALPRRTEAVPLAAFAAALAVREALARWAPVADLRLKWPNDVLLRGSKVAGLLLENLPEGLLIGIGVNLAHRPETPTHWPAGCLADSRQATSPPAEPDTVREALTPPLLRWLAAPPEAICAAWQEAAWGVGQPLALTTDLGELSGTCAGIDPQGRLRLLTALGERLLSTGRIVPPLTT